MLTPGCQEPNERRRVDGEGQLRGQHQVPETGRRVRADFEAHRCLEDEGNHSLTPIQTWDSIHNTSFSLFLTSGPSKLVHLSLAKLSSLI
jgi:hypothetical protein